MEESAIDVNDEKMMRRCNLDTLEWSESIMDICTLIIDFMQLFILIHLTYTLVGVIAN